MKYFCAQCQEWHDVNDIAIDVSHLCKEKVINSIHEIAARMNTNNDYVNFSTELNLFTTNFVSFINDGDDEIKKFFVFSGGKIRGVMSESHKDSLLSSITLATNMRSFYKCYRNSAAYKKSVQEVNSYYSSYETVAESFMDDTGANCAFDINLKVYFTKVKNGAEEVFVLSEYSSPDNDYFPKSKTIRSKAVKYMMGHVRVCSHCGHALSRAVGMAPETVVLLVGSPRAGKTSCIEAMISALMHSKYSRYGLSINLFEDDINTQALKYDIEEYYDRGYAVTKTEPQEEFVPAFSFLINAGSRQQVMTFVDMPGEFWADETGLAPEFMQKYWNTITQVDCIWYFISKTMAYGLNYNFNNELIQKLMLETSESAKIIRAASAQNIASKFLAISNRMNSSGSLMPPIATVITKTEVYIDDNDKANCHRYCLFPNVPVSDVASHNESESKKTISSEYALNETSYFERANRVRMFFRSLSDGLYCAAVEKHFDMHTYIGMSAYGHSAPKIGDETVPTLPSPFHEMMPLIWTLAITGTIPVNHVFVTYTRNIFNKVTNVIQKNDLCRFDFRRLLHINEKTLPRNRQEWFKAMSDIRSNLLMHRSNDGEILQYRSTET